MEGEWTVKGGRADRKEGERTEKEGELNVIILIVAALEAGLSLLCHYLRQQYITILVLQAPLQRPLLCLVRCLRQGNHA